MSPVERGGPGLVRTSLTAYGASVLVLLLGGAGLFAVTSSGTTTSLVRMGVAAGVLALLTGAVAVVVTPAGARSAARRWCWALAVPLLTGVGTAVLVRTRSGSVTATLAAAPWLAGAVLAGALSVALPDLSRGSVRQRRQDRRDRL